MTSSSLFLNSKNKRRGGGGGGSSSSVMSSSFVFASLVPAALLGFGAFALLLAHQSITDTNVAKMDQNYLAWRFPMDTAAASMSNMMGRQAQQQQQVPLPDGSLSYPPPPDVNDYFVQHPPDAYEEAFYLADEPDYETPQITYEDAHVLQLLANKSHVPFNVNRSPNGTSVLKDAGAHPVLTALRDLSNTEGFFNPVCFRYRFPNISMFPTMSVIVPMQNGTYVQNTIV